MPSSLQCGCQVREDGTVRECIVHAVSREQRSIRHCINQQFQSGLRRLEDCQKKLGAQTARLTRAVNRLAGTEGSGHFKQMTSPVASEDTGSSD